MDKLLTDEYQEYLTSIDWLIKRESAIEKAEHCCQECGLSSDQGAILQVHHKTYAHLGDESPEDLQVLCQDCHDEKHHNKANAQRRRMMTWAENYLDGYWNIPEENIEKLYRAFVRKKIMSRSR